MTQDIFSKCLKYVVQEETGEEGTPHLQGFLYYKNARSFKSVKKDLPRAHIEKARNVHAAATYCSKTETLSGRRWVLGFEEKTPVVDPMAGLTPYQWQQEILDLIETEPDRRAIHWLWEDEGNTGKTSLAFHICLHHKDAIYVRGKSADVKYAVSQMPDNPRVIIWDIPRCLDSPLSYEGMEDVKNGIFFNTKYESKMCLYNPPHVICFANYPPDVAKLSRDRWKISRIETSSV